MGLGDFFKGKKEEAMEKQKNDAPNHWLKCPGCNALMYYKEVFSQSHICPKCNYHFRISTQERLEMLCDKDTFIEIDKDLRPIDPLEFMDKKAIKSGLLKGRRKQAGQVQSSQEKHF